MWGIVNGTNFYHVDKIQVPDKTYTCEDFKSSTGREVSSPETFTSKSKTQGTSIEASQIVVLGTVGIASPGNLECKVASTTPDLLNA